MLTRSDYPQAFEEQQERQFYPALDSVNDAESGKLSAFIRRRAVLRITSRTIGSATYVVGYPALESETRLTHINISGFDDVMKNGADNKWRGERESAFRRLLEKRIVVLDGAMGTSIQDRRLSEEDFRGKRFAGHPHELKGNNDLLVLTQPSVIASIHRAFLEAGADVIETNTFNANAISQADYGLGAIARDLNCAAARVARETADRFMREHPGRQVFVAGGIGPTNRTASMSPDVNNPGFRAVTFDDLRQVYREQAAGLVEGGADTLLIETIFDTLNAKAAIFAVEELFDELGYRLPLQLSVTITDAAGRTLSGQTVEGFWNSVAHARPLSVGINCALGASDMRPYLEDLSRIAECPVSCYPNAGLPNAFGEYDDTPEHMASVLSQFARDGLLNIVGGCCGTTPEHLRAIAQAVRGISPRRVPERLVTMRLSGLEPLTIA